LVYTQFRILLFSLILLPACGPTVNRLEALKPGKKIHFLPRLDALGGELLGENKFQDRVRKILTQELGEYSPISLSKVRKNPGGGTHFTLTIESVPLCGFHLTATPWGSDVQILGNIPENLLENELEDFPEQREVETLLTEYLLSQGYELPGAISAERCYLKRDQMFFASVWKFKFNIKDLPYQAHADLNGVYNFHPYFYHASAKAVIYDKNILTNKLTTVDLKDLDNTGKLNGKYLMTGLPEASKATRATASQGVYDFSSSPTSWPFLETSVYANASLSIDWLQALGYSMPTKKVKLIPGIAIGGDTNNALYAPEQLGNPTTIYIGLGDGRILRNLSTDADVVSHEFGHHIVFQSVSRMDSGESIALHEGLADFLTFARTDDSCLGESICPKGSSSICNKCLRTASNQYSLTDKRSLGEEHLQGQIISGTLWEIKETAGLSGSEIGKIVINAISMLPANAIFEDFGVALVRGAAQTNPDICDAVKSVFNKRSWDRLLSTQVACTPDGKIDLEKTVENGLDIDRTSGVRQGRNQPQTTTRRTSENTSSPPCGAIGSKTFTERNHMEQWLMIMFFLLPLICLFPGPMAVRQEQVNRREKNRRIRR